MEPASFIASVNLASKLLPPAIDSLGNLFGPDKVGQNLPNSPVSFDRVLGAQTLRSDKISSPGDEVAHYLKSLPELQFEANREGWSAMSFELSEGGDLTIRRPGQPAQEVALSNDSRAFLREVYSRARALSPPLSPMATAVNLSVGALPESVGSSSGGRAISWRPA